MTQKSWVQRHGSLTLHRIEIWINFIRKNTPRESIDEIYWVYNTEKGDSASLIVEENPNATGRSCQGLENGVFLVKNMRLTP